MWWCQDFTGFPLNRTFAMVKEDGKLILTHVDKQCTASMDYRQVRSFIPFIYIFIIVASRAVFPISRVVRRHEYWRHSRGSYYRSSSLPGQLPRNIRPARSISLVRWESARNLGVSRCSTPKQLLGVPACRQFILPGLRLSLPRRAPGSPTCWRQSSYSSRFMECL
jgi:hypothetical protein